MSVPILSESDIFVMEVGLHLCYNGLEVIEVNIFLLEDDEAIGMALSYSLESEENTDDGLIVDHYSAPEAGDFISAYMLEYMSPAGETLVFTGRLQENSENAGFGAEDGRIRKVELSGMNDAIILDRDGGSALYMRHALPAPVSYADTFFLLDSWLDIETEEAGLYDEAFYWTAASGLSGNELLELVKD